MHWQGEMLTGSPLFTAVSMAMESQEGPKCVFWICPQISEGLICVYQCLSCCRLCNELVLDSEIEFLPEDSGSEHSSITTDE